MKKLQTLWPVLFASAAFATPAGEAGDSFFNHLTFSGRFGFNIKAGFGPRLTLDAGAFNYLDGYVLPDASGGFDPTGKYPLITHYWSYDNGARQDDTVNNEILLTALSGGDPLARSFGDCPRAGFELGYQRELGTHGKWHYGVEAAVNYMNLCLKDNISVNATGQQYHYPYSFPGRDTDPSQFYQGRYEYVGGGYDFQISQSPTPGSPTPVPVNLLGSRNFEADIWGFRLGPYLQRPLGEHFDLNLVGGLALVLVNSDASWSQTLTVNNLDSDLTLSGHGKDSEMLLGYYVGANVAWHLNKRWDVTAGVQYQDVGTYSKPVGNRQVELDLGQSVFVSVGLSFKF